MRGKILSNNPGKLFLEKKTYIYKIPFDSGEIWLSNMANQINKNNIWWGGLMGITVTNNQFNKTFCLLCFFTVLTYYYGDAIITGIHFYFD